MRYIMEDDNHTTPFFRSMQYLSKEVNPMKKEGQQEDPRRMCDEEGPMSTFFGEGVRCRNEERNEPKTHETFSLYLEE